MSPRDYHPDRPSTPAERQRRFRERHPSKSSSLERIDQAPPSRRQKLDAAALQQRSGPRPELSAQRLREHVDVGLRYGIPLRSFDTWIPTRRSRRLQAAREETSPVQVIPVTRDLEKQALAELARCSRRKRRKR